MYRNGCVVDVMYDIDGNGKLKSASAQNEDKSEARLPFGTEFSVFLRNRNNHDVAVELTLDGTNVLFGDGKIIIPAMDSVMIEGFSNRDGTGGQRFRFINSKGEEAESLGRVSGLRENGKIVARFYHANNPNSRIEQDKRKRDILDKLNEIQDDIRRSRPYIPPYIPPYRPIDPYHDPYSPRWEWYDKFKPYLHYGSNTNDPHPDQVKIVSTSFSMDNDNTINQYHVRSSVVNSSGQMRDDFELMSIRENLVSNADRVNLQEGVIETGSNHNQEWEHCDHEVGQFITAMEMKILGYENTTKICSSCGDSNPAKSKHCSECGARL